MQVIAEDGVRPSAGSEAIVHVVDDDDAVRHSLEWLLGVGDFAVRTYASAGEFLRSVDARVPGCLIVDLRMPGMDGFELKRELTARAIDLPVIVITGYSDHQLVNRAAHEGISYFLEKPLNDTMLMAIIDQVLGPEGSGRQPHA